MGSFGERLQREREMRGITLEEIAEATKIGTRSLRALEREDFDKLPGGIFNKGFVRAYSRYLGLDEEQAVADYMSALGEAQAATTKAGKTDGATINELADKNIRIVEAEGPPPIQVPWRPLIGLIVILAAVAAVWWYVATYGIPKAWHVRAAGQNSGSAQRKAESVVPHPSNSGLGGPPANALQQQNSGTPGTGANTVQAASSDATRAGANTLQNGEGFVLTIKAKQQAWVSVTTDGKTEPSELMTAGEQKMVRAQRRIVFRTGNAAAIELYQNEKQLPPLGAAGQVKKVSITAEGMAETQN
ncbi:MAG: helix-turn-helix domain-containing protein [Terriglobales bacterium]